MTSNTGMISNDERYYQLVLIWTKDEAKFSQYQRLVAPIVQLHDGRLERQVVPHQLYAERLLKPTVVNLVSSPSREGFDAFQRDQRFQDIVHLRSESIDMRSTRGPSARGAAGVGQTEQRLYVVEIARFGPGGEAAYRTYEAEAEPVMAKYGYHVERVFHPDAFADLPFRPDVVKVAYFDGPDGMDRLHGDPAHPRIESLYPQVAAESIWIIGRSSGPQ